MKAILIISLFILCIISVKAQKFEANLQCGIAGSQVSGDELSGFDKAGLIAGIGVKTPLNKDFSLGFKMLYLQKGSRKPSKLDQGDPSSYLLRLNYIEVPIQFRYKAGKKLFVELGPSFAYLVKHSEENEDGELENRNAFSKYDISITGAIVYPFNNHWELRVDGWQSILPIRKHSDGITYRLNQGQYNSVIAIGIQYTFKPIKE